MSWEVVEDSKQNQRGPNRRVQLYDWLIHLSEFKYQRKKLYGVGGLSLLLRQLFFSV